MCTPPPGMKKKTTEALPNVLNESHRLFSQKNLLGMNELWIFCGTNQDREFKRSHGIQNSGNRPSIRKTREGEIHVRQRNRPISFWV